MNVFVADTMAIILWLEKRKLPQSVKAIFKKIESRENKLYVPAMVLAEVGYLSEKGRIDINLQDVVDFINRHEKVSIHTLDIPTIMAAFEINDIPELHDRLISASGRALNVAVITNDPKILASEFVTSVWG